MRIASKYSRGVRARGMMNRKSKVFDFLKDEHFIQWVLNPTDESSHYWEKWISNHGDAKKEIELARQVIQSGSLKRNMPLPDGQYDQMLENIMTFAKRKKHVEAEKPTIKRYLAIAASIALLIISAVVFLQNDESDLLTDSNGLEKVNKEAPNGSKLTTRLPDGSEVILNSGSSLSYADNFQGDLREVYLIGEAFFKVEHNPSKPFIVHFGDQQVKVLGTSFNIRSYLDESMDQVAVATGKVAYSVIDGDQLLLFPNEFVDHKRGQLELSKSQFNKLEAFGWKDGILYFNSDPFDNIMNELERWYGVEIVIPSDFKPQSTYSGQFESATLKEVLTGLSFIYRFEYEINNSKVKITLK